MSLVVLRIVHRINMYKIQAFLKCGESSHLSDVRLACKHGGMEVADVWEKQHV